MIDEEVFMQAIDNFLQELGTMSIMNAGIARDQLMDLRLMLMESIEIGNKN